ncbi:MAG: 30S ribosomal protein S9 [Brevinematales bacterium]
MAQKKIYATGRRKTSVARVFLIPGGKGKFTVNNKDVEAYFPSYYYETVYYALNLTEVKGKVDIYATVKGGGLTGQAEALRHGISRALDAYDKEKFHKLLKENGLLTRDARMVERKKYGLKKARKSPQYSKR